MWNYLVHGLSLGCTLVLYDGSPLRDPAYLWRLVDELGITIFGTSAKYIDQLSVRAQIHNVFCFHGKAYFHAIHSIYRKCISQGNQTSFLLSAISTQLVLL